MGRTRTYTDAALEAAVAESRSWRGVLRVLGLSATSSAAARSVRKQADRLGLDYAHFTGQRRWSDQEFAAAVGESATWSAVAEALGLSGGSSTSALKGHAARLGLDVDHLTRSSSVPPARAPMAPDPAMLRRAGSLLAASWFTLCGYDVSWPLEPTRYDLIVVRDRIERVQVKTTTLRAKSTWLASLTTNSGRRTYAPDEIDSFFIVDGDLACYHIPVAVLGGRRAVHVAAYDTFRVGRLTDGFGALGARR